MLKFSVDQSQASSSFRVIDPFENNLKKIESQTNKALVNLENKYKILLKSDSEIFSRLKLREDPKKK